MSQQLMIDFMEAVQEFQSASEKVVSLATQIEKQGTPAQRGKARECVSDARRLFNRIVRTYAVDRCGGDFRRAYSKVYALLACKEGWHPLLHTDDSRGTLLDAIEARGRLNEAISAARQLLVMA